MKYNSIGEQLIAKAQELDPSYKPDKFNDMSEAIDVILNNSGRGYKIKELVVTENGVYDGEFEAYKPVRVNVPQTASGTVKALLDATRSAFGLFSEYNGTNVDSLISFNDTANVTNMNNMFYNCSNLTAIPILDTSKVTNMHYMFYNCSNLTAIPALDTSKVTNMSGIFEKCTKLTAIPLLDTSKVTDMIYMFYNCSNLTTIPHLDTSKVRDMSYMFYNCSNLTTIPELDAQKLVYNSSLEHIFSGCTKLTSIGLYGFRYSIDISSTALGHDALVAFLNQAGTAFNSSQKITMGADKLALLSDEEKAIATNKGWTLA